MAARDPSESLRWPETQARQVWALRSFERDGDSPLWTREDRRWASQLACETAGSDASPAAFIAERARHALQRLEPRVAGLQQALRPDPRARGWMLGVLGTAFVAGVAIDQLGGSQRINLLAPPVWAVVLWNLAVYAWMSVLAMRAGSAGGWWRRALRRWLQPATRGAAALVRVHADWIDAGAPLALARVGAATHAAAALLALGLIAGMYLRGLVFDFRAGWQSTFLDAGTAQALLNACLAPAQALTGIAVPDVAPLRLHPDQAPVGPAAPWLHLYAATLLIAVVVPRAVLALLGLLRAWHRSAALPLPMDAYFAQLLATRREGPTTIAVATLGIPPTPAQVLALQRLAQAAWGAGARLSFAPPASEGHEDELRPDARATLALAFFDAMATPEAERHGRLITALQAHSPVMLVVDEAAFAARFAALPQRLAERRRAWQDFGRERGLATVCLRLDDERAHDAAAAALQGAAA